MSVSRTLMRSAFLVILAGAVFLSAVGCSVGRANASGDTGPEVWQGQAPLPLEVFSEGRARLKGGEDDVRAARARAVVEAEKEALLGALKQLIHTEVFFQEKDYLLRLLVAKKGSLFLEPGLIVGEGAEADAYVVRMNARISREGMEELLIRFAAARRILVSVSDSLDGKPSKGHVLGSALASAARTKKYKVVYQGEFADEKTKSLVSAWRSGDREAGRALGLYLLTATIIEGRVQASYSEVTGEIYSSRAEGSLRVTGIGGKRASFSVRDVKGFGSNETKAGADAMRKASVILSSKTMKSLSGRQKKA